MVSTALDLIDKARQNRIMFINCKEVIQSIMETETQTTLEGYTSLFHTLKQRVGDAVAATAILQEVARDRRAHQIRAERQAERGEQDSESATQKQIEFLKNLKMDIPQGLTKQAASALIDEGRARRLAEKLEAY